MKVYWWKSLPFIVYFEKEVRKQILIERDCHFLPITHLKGWLFDFHPLLSKLSIQSSCLFLEDYLTVWYFSMFSFSYSEELLILFFFLWSFQMISLWFSVIQLAWLTFVNILHVSKPFQCKMSIFWYLVNIRVYRLEYFVFSLEIDSSKLVKFNANIFWTRLAVMLNDFKLIAFF